MYRLQKKYTIILTYILRRTNCKQNETLQARRLEYIFIKLKSSITKFSTLKAWQICRTVLWKKAIFTVHFNVGEEMHWCFWDYVCICIQTKTLLNGTQPSVCTLSRIFYCWHVISVIQRFYRANSNVKIDKLWNFSKI